MGISEGSPAVDCSVGTIVWVRRRNGSWWPGRILGPHELAASHIMSPRSGTPVKLLGREDASVDWYNLEKSKRVKAFRCGEFDDCIEKAESCQGMPIKKREKYARREDAILHALELEKQLLEKKQQKLGVAPNYMSNKMPGTSKKEFSTFSPSENHEGNDGTKDHCKFMNVKTQLPPKSSDSFLGEENMHDPLYIQKGKLMKDLNWEDENSESIPRMRGLQDFGLRTAPSKRKLSVPVAYESLRKPFSVDNHAHPSSGEHNIGDANHVSSIKTSLGIKRKRSLGGVNEESLVKRRDRRRPLVQVLKSSAKLPASHSVQSDGDALSISALGGKDQGNAIFRAKRSRCIYLPADSNACLDHMVFSSDQMQASPSYLGVDKYLLHPGSLTEENMSPGLIEAQESDSSETDSLGFDLDEEAAVLSDPHPRNLGRHVDRSSSVLRVPGQPGNVNNEELDECALSSDMCELHPHEQTSDIAADIGGSKWQLKGKRNIRNLAKRPMEAMDGRDPIITAEKCNGSIHGSFFETRGSVPKLGRMVSQRALERVVHHGSDELNHAYYEGGLIDNDFGQGDMAGYGNRRCPLSLKASSRDRGRSNNNFTSSDEDSHLMSPTVQRAASLSQAASRGYWEEPHECFDPMYAGHLINGVETMLIDVDLKVQASYQGERVPLVSLMSRLNGKAIIGHPVQIEPMEDGSSDLLLSTNELGECLPETDGNTGLPPVWRTARRTAMHRVPRSHQPVALDGEEADPTYYSDLEREPLFKKPNAGCSDHKVSLAKKNLSHIHRPVVDKKFPKKLLKKMSLSSQKTRTLSSIATEQNPSAKKNGPKQSDKTGDFDSLIKPEKTVPSVTCIPVKLVFSRILEAVGRPPSKAATSFAEWKPS